MTRRVLVTAFIGAFVTLTLLNAALWVAGVSSELTFWRWLTISSLALVGLVSAQNTGLLRDIDRWAMLCEQQQHVLSTINALPTVICAGCHVRCALTDAGVTPEGEPGMALPPDWEMHNDRPYCPVCVKG